MNEQDKKIVDFMVDFIEKKEREVQVFGVDKKVKSKVVDEILKELGKLIENED